MAPSFGATFVPGGFDDYFMPEVVAPSPQRIMPEVPENMQKDLQRLELKAGTTETKTADAFSPTSVYSQPSGHPDRDFNGLGQKIGSTATTNKAQEIIPPPADFKPFNDLNTAPPKLSAPASDAPSFSPFPKIKGDNIPPAYEEKEEILWNTRDAVLHSNNVTWQLAWAKDTLQWVEVVMEDSIRELAGKSRPPTPKVEHELRIDAFNIVSYLADQEHPEALYLRSKMLEFGKFGLRPDKREAYNGYVRSAELGWSRAEYRMGMLYEQSSETRKAIEHYEKGLLMKDTAASYRLGMMSLQGQHGQIKDYQRGLELIQTAADNADEDAPQGAYVYGLIIARELPDIVIPEGLLPYRLDIARMYIEKAAFLGFAKAQLKIGQAYELCQLGCDFNPSFSLHYYGLAAKQGLPEAALGVSRWFLFGYDGFFTKNEKLAYKYAQQASAAKLPTGEFAMGYYCEIGIHVPKDLREARRWYELAAEHGNKDAVGRLESLNQQKSLTKQDHETTTLGRIKSQHGSMRGKRPDRFKQTPHMPTLDEGEGGLDPRSSVPPKQSPKASPKASPHATPPATASDGATMPDPSRLSIQDSRPPAFAVNVGGAPRPKSTAPYPEDDRPPPLNLNRPKSTAPYPDDDVAGRPLGSPQFSPNYRQPQGPQADRPMSAFGIRPVGGQVAPGGVRQSASMANLVPNDPRSRLPSGAYRQPSPGPPGGEYRRDEFRNDFVRPATTQPQPYDQRQGGPAPNNPAHNRLQKPNPNPQKLQTQPPVSGAYPGGPPQGYGQAPLPSQPGRDYGPRTSSRPVSSHQPIRPMSENFDRQSRVPGPGRMPDRIDSLPSQGGHGPRPVQLMDRPIPLDDGPGRVGSAPPASQQRPQARPTAPLASAATAPAKQSSQGPSTFEEMGIPQGKAEGDCVVM